MTGVQLAYSLDMLLPGIKLRNYHYDEVKLTGWARYYFYFHIVMGYVRLAAYA